MVSRLFHTSCENVWIRPLKVLDIPGRFDIAGEGHVRACARARAFTLRRYGRGRIFMFRSPLRNFIWNHLAPGRRARALFVLKHDVHSSRLFVNYELCYG